MKIISTMLVILSVSLVAQIKQHPGNPHYFIYKDKPTVLITSGEHYGAVINLEFNYRKYLETLSNIGLNHTRIFLGDYVEEQNSFCIEDNTLAPKSKYFITPWMRSKTPGYVLGGNKFDLDKWNPDYFERLHDFMKTAEENEIIVEAVLFFSGYLIKNSPFYHANNINGTDSISGNEYMILDNGNILSHQKIYTEKIVRELNRYDNLIFNIANEPWFDNQLQPGFASTPPEATMEWIQRVSEWIVGSEKDLPKNHILSIDYMNEGQEIPHDQLNDWYKNITVFNHHYDRNSKSAELNYGKIDRILSFNETGLMPASTPQYRIQGWKYLFSGGALYNNLDFTFQVGKEDGKGTTDFTCDWYSGCTDPEVKYYLANLLKFMNRLNFIKMKPDFHYVALNYGDENIYPLVWEGNQYAVYFEGGSRAKVKLIVPSGKWKVTWFNPSDLKVIETFSTDTKDKSLDLLGPVYTEDIVVLVEKLK